MAAGAAMLGCPAKSRSVLAACCVDSCCLAALPWHTVHQPLLLVAYVDSNVSPYCRWPHWVSYLPPGQQSDPEAHSSKQEGKGDRWGLNCCRRLPWQFTLTRTTLLFAHQL